MVSRKNYHLNPNEEIFIPLTSKLCTYFIDGFTSGMTSNCLFGKWKQTYVLDFGP